MQTGGEPANHEVRTWLSNRLPEPETSAPPIDERASPRPSAPSQVAPGRRWAVAALLVWITEMAPRRYGWLTAGVGAATVGVDAIVGTLAAVTTPTFGGDIVGLAAVFITEAVALAVAALVRTRAIRAIAGVIELMLASITLLMALVVLALLALFSMFGSGAGGSMISAPTEAGVLAVVAVALGLGFWAAARLCLALVLFARKAAPAAASME